MTAERTFRRKNRPGAQPEADSVASARASGEADTVERPKVFRRQKAVQPDRGHVASGAGERETASRDAAHERSAADPHQQDLSAALKAFADDLEATPELSGARTETEAAPDATGDMPEARDTSESEEIAEIEASPSLPADDGRAPDPLLDPRWPDNLQGSADSHAATTDPDPMISAPDDAPEEPAATTDAPAAEAHEDTLAEAMDAAPVADDDTPERERPDALPEAHTISASAAHGPHTDAPEDDRTLEGEVATTDSEPQAEAPDAGTEAPETDSSLVMSAARSSRWSRLAPVLVDAQVLDRNRIITATRYDPAHSAFDVLRTRLLQAITDRGWSRIAITSPTKGCGKTFTAANLAISLARQENCPTILFDTDLRDPMLAKTFGVESPGSIGDMLRGRITPEDHLRRLGPNAFHAGPNLAFAFNEAPEPYASELLQDARTAETLSAIAADFAPKLMLFDMPPALYGDDVLAMRPLIDAVILVVGGGLTTANEIREVENRLGAETPLLGVVLNRAEGTRTREYGY